VRALFRRPARRDPSDVAQGFGYVELHGGGSRVVIVPALGGKIAALVMGGRQWLWTSDAIPFREAAEDSPYDAADSGGFDECFPTVAPCTLPSGPSLADHGELWSQRAAVDVVTGDDGSSATCAWRGRTLPYEFMRRVRARPDGSVTMEYAVTNEGREKLPYLWSAHPLLPLAQETRLIFPEMTRVRVASEHGIALGGTRAEHRWPFFRLQKAIADFSRPHDVARRYACKLFVDGATGLAAVEEGDLRLEAAFDAAEIPAVGVWINRRGRPQARGGSRPMVLALEPCSGAPDSLCEALGEWRGARWIEPGETANWTVHWRARRLGPPAPGAPAR
jgi:galactose mutarotase-like enzyme